MGGWLGVAPYVYRRQCERQCQTKSFSGPGVVATPDDELPKNCPRRGYECGQRGTWRSSCFTSKSIRAVRPKNPDTVDQIVRAGLYVVGRVRFRTLARKGARKFPRTVLRGGSEGKRGETWNCFERPKSPAFADLLIWRGYGMVAARFRFSNWARRASSNSFRRPQANGSFDVCLCSFNCFSRRTRLRQITACGCARQNTKSV